MDIQNKRVLMYSHDGFGLGHLRRNYSIAQSLREHDPDINVLLVSGAPSMPFFEVSDGIDVVKLPSIIRSDRGVYDERTLCIGTARLQKIRETLIRHTVEAYDPDLLLVDHVPVGVWGELASTLDYLVKEPNPPWIILGIRDILDTPESIIAQWKEKGCYEAIRNYYDKIYIYGRQEIFEADIKYEIRGITEIDYCGYLCHRHAPRPERLGLEARERAADESVIVVTGGGGGDAYPMMAACVEALAGLALSRPVRAFVVAGPLMAKRQRRALEEQARGLPVTVLPYVSDLGSLLRSADLVVTMGGYNSLLEAVSAGTKVLAIPRTEPSAEQRMRTAIFAELGLIDAVDLSQARPSDLAQIIHRKLADERVAAPPLQMDGLDTVARRVLGLLDERPGKAGRGKRVNGAKASELAGERGAVAGVAARGLCGPAETAAMSDHA